MPLQSRELNEFQLCQDHKLASIGGALFEDGDIVSGEIAQQSEVLRLKNVQIYLAGFVRPIPDQEIKVPKEAKGVWVEMEITAVSKKEDPSLTDPAPGENHGEEGAMRRCFILRVSFQKETPSKTTIKAKIFDVVNGMVVFPTPMLKMRQICQKMPFDDVVHIAEISSRSFPPGSRILVTGNTQWLENAPLVIKGHNLDVTFHPNVRVIAKANFTKDTMVSVEGKVALRDLKVGWEKTGNTVSNSVLCKEKSVCLLHGLLEINFQQSITTKNCIVFSHAGIQEEVL